MKRKGIVLQFFYRFNLIFWIEIGNDEDDDDEEDYDDNLQFGLPG